jgi:hypothetical protein
VLPRERPAVARLDAGRYDLSIEYTTFDSDASEVLRLKSAPTRITSGTTSLAIVNEPPAEGYAVKPLPGGNVVVRIHHRNARTIKLTLAE